MLQRRGFDPVTSGFVAILFNSRLSDPLVFIDKLKAKHSRSLQIISYKRLSEMQHIFITLEIVYYPFYEKNDT